MNARSAYLATACLCLGVSFFGPSIFAAEPPAPRMVMLTGPAYQTVFFGVLEGLYRDGVSDDDLNQILRKTSKGNYEHFIYACPIFTAAIHAFELYRDRPPFYGLKPVNYAPQNRTFGEGLDEKSKADLRDESARARLTAINRLMSRWISQRLDSQNLSVEDKEEILTELRAGRREGMKFLQRWQETPEKLEQFAPAYAEIGECAVCNAAVQMKFPAENK